MNDLVVETDNSSIVKSEHVTENITHRGQFDALMLKAVESGGVEALERIIALKEREEDRYAKVMFDEAFAMMQSEFLPVSRSKKGYDYKYAPLEVLQEGYGPIIAQHGFSYSWREEVIEKGKRCYMTISGHGHSRENYFDVPDLGDPKYKKQMNDIQVAGAMSTYGRRYTFIAGFAVSIQDEDSDGIPAGTGAEYADEVMAIESCNTLQELMATWKSVLDRVRGNRGAMKYLAEIKDSKKKELQ